MRFLNHQTLTWVTIGAALAGQMMLDTSPQPAILLCGIALTAALLDGWWYLVPLGSRWWYPALLGFVGLTMWEIPRGWFLMAWAAIELGTGLRATSIWRRYQQAMAEEQARVDRLREMGFRPAGSEEMDAAEAASALAEAEPPAPLPPIVWWRYPLALALGLLAACIGAWCTRVAFYVTNWQTDVLAIFTGYLVGKAVAMGAGERSNRFLQVAAAVIAGAGVLYGRYLVLRYFFETSHKPYTPLDVVVLALAYPGKLLGPWLLLFLGVGIWAGWRYARVDPDQPRR